MTDPIDPFEESTPRPGASDRAFARTAAVVRRRRHLRRAASIAIVVAAYAAGVATHALAGRQDGPARHDPRIRVAPAPPPPTTAAQIEARAAVARTPAEHAILLKAAGDRYLNEAADVEAALRCYRALLDLTPAADRTRIDTTDSWLFAALKHGSD